MRCDSYLMICSDYGDSNSGTECYCNREKGHKGKHRATVTTERGTTDEPIHEETEIYWDAKSIETSRRIPDGTPGIRDVDNVCEYFTPGDPCGDCEGDGHYLCLECEGYRPADEDSE